MADNNADSTPGSRTRTVAAKTALTDTWRTAPTRSGRIMRAIATSIANQEVASIAIEYESQLDARPGRLVHASLSRSEIDEFQQDGLKSDLTIEIGGVTGPRNNNIVVAGGQPMALPGAPFRLFLRLALQVWVTQDAFVSFAELSHQEGLDAEERIASEGEVAPRGIPQAIQRLQDCFKGAVGGLPTKKFIASSLRDS